jgi:2-methylcitrate dehydratase PrpD
VSADAASFRRYVLPKDLPAAIKQLDDQELDRLLAAAVAEQRRRGRKAAMSVETSENPRTETATIHLTPGKLNAVRAAFKVGVKPSQIARQFGLSQADVRKALASDASRRMPNYG